MGGGPAWMKIFKTWDFEGYSGTLMVLSFMTAGAIIDGPGEAFLLSLLTFREPDQAHLHRQRPAGKFFGNRPHSCNAKLRIALRASSAI